MISLRQLLTPVSEDDLLAFCLDTLDSLGFQATSWQTTSAARIFTQLLARIGSDLTFSIADIAASGFAGLAKGPYADLLGQYMFQLLRVQASATVGQMVLTSSIAAPVHTWLAGELIIADAPQGSTANTYEVTDPDVLNPGTSLVVNVKALTPGSKANVPPNLTTLQLWTPLVTVSVTNPPQPPATPVNTWIITPGTDSETDGPGGRYNARMLGRWDRLTYGNTDGAYTAWTLEALPAITRLSVREGATEGSVHIVAATAVGGVDAGQIAAIIAYLTGATDGVGRRPINDVLEVVSANQVTTPPLGVAIVVKSPFAADAITRVSDALITFIGTLPIGGKKIGNSSVGKVLIADLYALVMAQQGLVNVVFSIGDIALAADDIYAAIPTITMTTVS